MLVTDSNLDSGGHIDDFFEHMDSTVEYLYSKFVEFLFLLLFNSLKYENKCGSVCMLL